MKPRWPRLDPDPPPQPHQQPRPYILYVTQHLSCKYSQGAAEDGSKEIVRGARTLPPPAPGRGAGGWGMNAVEPCGLQLWSRRAHICPER